ncbi:MAG: hypothetical protein Q4D96_14040 [Propionibacteriaceae bacterium]|nr:hypothetical protein [Propionibacteriaceae bacterium]
MTLLDLLVRIDDRINAEVDKHVHKHPTAWIIATSLLIVVMILTLRGALQ